MSKVLNKILAILLILSFGISTDINSVYADSASNISTKSSVWDYYKQGIAYKEQKKYDLAIIQFEKALPALSNQAQLFGHLAECYEYTGQYQKASDNYYKKADLLNSKGLTNEYLAVKKKADSLNSEIEFYIADSSTNTSYKLGKYEPTNGAYIGAYISQEELYKTDQFKLKNGNEFKHFNEKIGKKHATFFDYGSYGSSLSESFQTKVDEIKETNGAMHIAYEPGKLSQVTQAGIRAYAEELRDTKIPIFLRYASEMNGDWVPWNGNPSEYIKNFRMVHDIMEEVAPNVAMVWSPSEMPLNKIQEYYPGDNYVDWVGISIYSAQFENGDLSKPTDTNNPLDPLDYIYNLYASRKPIMISEYAASHQAGYASKKQDTSKFAINKMSMFYEGIKTKYPRVKCIQWFSQDNYNLEDSSKNRVNYSLLEGENKGILKRYKEIVSDNYFLSDVVNGPYAKTETSIPSKSVKLTNQAITKTTKTYTWVKTYDPYISKVVFKINGNIVGTRTNYPYSIDITLNNIQKGINTFEAIAYDSNGKVAKSQSTKLYKPFKTNKHISLQTGSKYILKQDSYNTLDTAIYTKNSRMMVPLRFISENFGINVDYNSTTKKITLKGNNKTIVLEPNKSTVNVNGKTKSIDVAPEVLKGTTFVPIRFISEELGKKVSYEGSTQRTFIE